MKIGEAQGIYREQVNAYREQKSVLSKRLQNIRSRIKTPEDQEAYGAEAATLELTLEALDEKQKEYQDYLSKLSEKYCAYWNATVAEQQKDATKEYAADMAKLLEVARRIMKGASVPASDEKKLMEFSSDMYQMAKNIGAMVQRQKREKYEYYETIPVNGIFIYALYQRIVKQNDKLSENIFNKPYLNTSLFIA